MGRGDYKAEFGGSKSGYEKGVKDTLKVVGVFLVSAVSVIIAVFNAKKK